MPDSPDEERRPRRFEPLGRDRQTIANWLAVGSPLLFGVITVSLGIAVQRGWLPVPPLGSSFAFVNLMLAVVGATAGGFLSIGSVRYRVVITFGAAIWGFVAYLFLISFAMSLLIR